MAGTERNPDKILPLDLTFIINEPKKTLKDRFDQLIKDCRFFCCLFESRQFISRINKDRRKDDASSGGRGGDFFISWA